MKKGYIAAFSAYFWWGISPIYWKLISSIPALEILGVRAILSLPALLLILIYTKKLLPFKEDLKQTAKIWPYIISAFLLATNWFIWIWSMNNNYVVEASLGYFINPLVNVVIGLVLFGERLRRAQWLALFLALVGVLYLAINYGHFPWIALSLAGTFALYGYIKKTAKMGAINGLTTEMMVLIIPSFLLMGYLSATADFTLPMLTWDLYFLLSLTAVITIVPLVVFAYGAKRIPFSTLGFLQYIAPTLQFLLGLFLYNEDFNQERLIGFSFIWLALIIYTTENIYVLKQKSRS